jgi:FkbM family methyltransferase
MSNPIDRAPTSEDVALAYRLILGREPDSAEVVEGHRRSHASRRALLETFLGSDELRFAGVESLVPPPASDLARRVAEFLGRWQLPSREIGEAHWRDPLGVLVRTDFRDLWADRGGETHASPEASELVEWLALADALESAGASFCMIELGAGHAPWLVRAGAAWRHRRGAAPLRLVGLEGEPTHAEFMRRHAADNGLDEPDVALACAAVGVVDGEVEFELSDRPEAEWGTRLAGEVDRLPELPRIAPGAWTTLPAWSLATLLRGLPVVDLVHCDIQGSEAEVLLAAGSLLGERVKRMFVGTHGRRIEAELLEALPGLGFELRGEKACRYRLDGRRFSLVEDGAQYWVHRGPPSAARDGARGATPGGARTP